jgi:hypothetical protein
MNILNKSKLKISLEKSRTNLRFAILGPTGPKNTVGKSLIPPISAKRTITSHLKSLSTKKTKTYDVGNPGPVLPYTGYLFSFVYICIAVGDPVIKRGGLGSHLQV